MQLLTDEIKAKMPALYSQEKVSDPVIICKFFTPWSNWTWYVLEGKELNDGDYEFFGLVDGFEKELGYFCLSDLQVVEGPGGLKIERDLYFGDNHRLSEFK